MQANKAGGRFTENTDKATSYEKVVQAIEDQFADDDRQEVKGNPQRVPLPFKCESETSNWEIQFFLNSDC